MRAWAWALAILLLAIGAAVFAAGAARQMTDAPATKTTRVILGEMTIRSNIFRAAGGCTGKDGFDDIQAGAPVTVKDQAGTIIATGSLDPGTVAPDSEGREYCRFGFSIPNVPDASFYTVEVARRGGLTYSKADLEAIRWIVHASLG